MEEEAIGSDLEEFCSTWVVAIPSFGTMNLSVVASSLELVGTVGQGPALLLLHGHFAAGIAEVAVALRRQGLDAETDVV